MSVHRATAVARREQAIASGIRAFADHGPAMSSTWIGSNDVLPMESDFFAADHFHPSALGYSRWAAAVADHLITEGPNRSPPATPRR